MNPFKYGQVVSGKEFCKRPELQKNLKNFLEACQNVVLLGERRVGKTSLIYETVRNLDSRTMLYVDLMEIKTTDDLCNRIISAVVSMKRKDGILERVVRSLAQFRPVIALDPISGQPSISFDKSQEFSPDSIDSLLDLICELNDKKPLVVVFDEFQDIENISDTLEIVAKMRSKIQFHSNLPYIFAGSIRNRMSDLFVNPDSAFFKSAAVMHVGPIPSQSFSAFLLKKFKRGDRRVTNSDLVQIMKIADNVPGDIQALCQCLWDSSNSGSSLNSNSIQSALELVYTRESKGYETILTMLTSTQLKCLTGLARVNGKKPMSIAFMRLSGIKSPASVQSAIKKLIKLRIIYHYEQKYKFVNPFFKSWLIWKNY